MIDVETNQYDSIWNPYEYICAISESCEGLTLKDTRLNFIHWKKLLAMNRNICNNALKHLGKSWLIDICQTNLTIMITTVKRVTTAKAYHEDFFNEIGRIKNWKKRRCPKRSLKGQLDSGWSKKSVATSHTIEWSLSVYETAQLNEVSFRGAGRETRR